MQTPVELPKDLFGHSKEGCSLNEWQTLDRHLNAVASRAAEFAKEFSSGEWAWIAGSIHDLGKIDRRFQVYLRRENQIDDPNYDDTEDGKVNHSSAGAALVEEWWNEKGRPFGRPLSYIIAGHHAGLPDYHVANGGRGALEHRLLEGRQNLEEIRSFLSYFESQRDISLKLPSSVKSNNFHFWVRMLFSCLVDSDFLDTEAFMNPARAAERFLSYEVKALADTLNRHLDNLMQRSPQTQVNAVRREILSTCKTAARKAPGLYSLTVPTGGGKTLSALSFALYHCVQHAKKRVIYVIPFTSIIEQTSEILRKIFGEDMVIEHHSNLDPQKETLRACIASENWDAPLIVTTSVQFFESLFASRTSACRKLHNLVNSVIILDEAQLIPPEKLKPCVFALNELTKNYGATVVLATATQPALPGLQGVTEIINQEMDLYSKLSRVKVEFPSDINVPRKWEDLAEELSSFPQVLCIVNSRRDCLDLFRLMPKGTIHLSTLMCGEHRSRAIADLKKRLLQGDSVRAISTQLVEAGVDIDFPRVYRALCGLDSIAQAAGRCNREGRIPDKGRVIVFVPPKNAPPGLLRKGEAATIELYSLGKCNIESAEHLKSYFDLFYNKVNDHGESYLKDLSPSGSDLLDVSFRSVGSSFRIIDDQGRQAVSVRYGEGPVLIEELRQFGPTRTLLRKLQRFSVSLPQKAVERLRADGYVEEPWPGFFAQAITWRYDEEVGLDYYNVIPAVEDLIM